MVDWRRLFGRGTQGPDRSPPPDDPGPPPLDPPDVTAARVARNAARARAEWAALRARQPGIEAQRITRPMLDAALRDAGYRRRRIDGEAVFVKSLSDRSLGIFPRLRTIPESEVYAPSQRLSLIGSVSLDRAARIDRHLMGARASLHATAHVPEIECSGFVLTLAEVEAAIAAMDSALATLDIGAALARHRALDPAQPGSAGLHHLVALVLDGDTTRLSAYARTRAAGGSAGFHPYITDTMIDQALALARIVATDGVDALDAHLPPAGRR